MKHNRKRATGCIVANCWRKNRQLFAVPHKESKVFGRWNKLLNLNGPSRKQICDNHFKPEDFIIVKRRRLRNTAVPSILPVKNNIVTLKRGCCITGCRKTKSLVRIPPIGSLIRVKWNNVLNLPADVSWLGICQKHFKPSDFEQKTSRYLKPNSIPSRGITPKRKRIKQKCFATPSDTNVPEHGYSVSWRMCRSRTMCFVPRCTARAGNGIKLHGFPRDKVMLKAWIHRIKRKRPPSKYSKICSRHFTNLDYQPGGKRLKPTAYPSICLPSPVSLHLPNPKNVKRTVRNLNSLQLHGKALANSILSPSSNQSDSDTDTDLNRNDHTSINSVEMKSDTTALSPVNFNMPTEVAATPAICHVNTMTDNIKHETNDPFSEDLISKMDETDAIFFKTVGEQENKTTLTSLIKTDKDAIVWTGVASLEQLDSICISVKIIEAQLYKVQFKLSAIDRVILTLAKLKQNISFIALATLFDIAGSTVSQYFNHTIQVLAEILQKFLYWPNREEIAKNIPLCFRGKFEKVRCVLDCTEIPVTTLKCINCCIACYSNYKGRRTIKFLIGVTPAGLISYVSEAYSGKASDKQIFNEQNFIELLDAFTDEIMVDKGFNIQQECFSKGIRLHIPPFLRTDRHTERDAMLNESIAKSRIHVERTIQRIKIFGIMQSAVEASVLGAINSIMTVICALVNLSAPILKDDKF